MSSPVRESGQAVVDRSREIELFQLAARTALGVPSERRLDDLLARTIDWDYVLSTGGLHGILPLLQVHLGMRETTVPSPVRLALRERCERVARSNLYLSSRLIEIVEALTGAGVPALTLKGPAVAVALYDSLFLREFGDLDILVKSADVPRATQAVESLGFVPWRTVEGAQEEVLQHVEYSRTFTRPADDLDLDLHWDLARSFFRGRIEAESLWADTSSFDLSGTAIQKLPPDLFLLALCVHGAKHGPFPWPRMKWICDVAEFIRRSEGFDWGATFERARGLGCRRSLLLGLAVARPLTEDGLPSAVEEQLAGEPQVEDLARRVWRWLASDRTVSLSFSERAAIDMALIDDGGGKLSYAVRRILTPTKKDWGTRSLPRHFSLVYIPLRFVRLAGQYLPRPWRLRRLLSRERPDSEDHIDP
jgi:hypothetical protein